MNKVSCLVAIAAALGSLLEGAEKPVAGGYADYEKLIADSHASSLKVRESALRKTIAKDTAWPGGVWGDNFWCLSALYLNEKTDEANARLLKRAKDFIASTPGSVPATSPENPGNLPWNFFSITDYVRTLCLFHTKSSHFPGRLKPETEAAMKEALWLWVRGESRLADAGADDLFLLLGTENHDLNRRPPYYLITALLQEDSAYRERKLADGRSVSEHAAAYTRYYREWPVSRAGSGMWVEIGSNGYQKYSIPALFNLHELSPDPIIRRRFGLLLDLALIEEEQISVKGRRGGGRSRADNGKAGFDAMKSMLYGEGGGSSHSRVLETSRYQAPDAAILLRSRTFPAAQAFVIRNRVPGELGSAEAVDGHSQLLTADSSLINYAYRSRHYLLGSTLQNPALSLADPKGGARVLKYTGISRQKRACGLLLDDPTAKSVSQVFPLVEHPGGGRSQHSFWSVQHENVLLIQRIGKLGRSTLGSYNTGKISMCFEGADLKKIEKDGWIFASNGKAFAAVKFLDGGHTWDATKTVAHPAKFNGSEDTSRILMHAGDITSHPSLDDFCKAVRSCKLTVTPDKVDYRFGKTDDRIEMARYDVTKPKNFTLPLINGKAIDLHPKAVYESPYLNGKFGGDKFTVSVGPITRVLDFSK